MFASVVENLHIIIIILSEIDRQMYCGRGCTSQVREPVSQLVPFEKKHDCQTHHPASDVIGFLVKRRCVRSRRLLLGG